MSLFRWQELRIRANPAMFDTGAAMIHQGSPETVILNCLRLRGFERDANGRASNAMIDKCYFDHDESVPVGELVIEPIDSKDAQWQPSTPTDTR